MGQLEFKQELPLKSALNACAEPYLSQSPLSSAESIAIPISYYFDNQKREEKQTQNRSQCSTDASNTKSIDMNLQNETTESQEIVYHEGAYDGRCSSNDKDSTITPISPPSYSHPKRKKLNKTMQKQKRHGPSWSAIAKQADAQTSTAESSPKAKPKATTNPTKKKTKAKPRQKQEK